MQEDEHPEETAEKIIAETSDETAAKAGANKAHSRKKRGSSATQDAMTDDSAVSTGV